MMAGVCLSVRLSVAFLDLTREREGVGSPKLTGWKPGNPYTYLEVKMLKVKVVKSINMVTDTASGRGVAIFLKLACIQ